MGGAALARLPCVKYRVAMRAIRGVSAIAAGAHLALPVTAYTASPGTTSWKAAAAASPAPPGAASPPATPSPTGPAVTITPGNSAHGADPAQGITVTAAGGTL